MVGLFNNNNRVMLKIAGQDDLRVAPEMIVFTGGTRIFPNAHYLCAHDKNKCGVKCQVKCRLPSYARFYAE